MQSRSSTAKSSLSAEESTGSATVRKAGADVRDAAGEITATAEALPIFKCREWIRIYSDKVIEHLMSPQNARNMPDADAAQAYQDVVARLLGEERPMRFTEAVKTGFFKRIFGGR